MGIKQLKEFKLSEEIREESSSKLFCSALGLSAKNNIQSYWTLLPDYLRKASNFHYVISISALFYLLRNEKKAERKDASGGWTLKNEDTQNSFIEKYHLYYLHIHHNLFSFYSKTVKFNKLKYHFKCLRQARVQGFGGFEGSILLQFYSRKLTLQSPEINGAICEQLIIIYCRGRGIKNTLWSETVIDIQKIKGEKLI